MVLAGASNLFVSGLRVGGLVGSWSPGIGDPSIAGWLTVVLYFMAAYLCGRLALGDTVRLARREASVWWLFTIGLIALGINKQLDLQTALTEIGRMLARQQGWYEVRRSVQASFIVVITLLGVVTIALMVWVTRRMPAATRIALGGGDALITFVVIRAASFHHVDRLIGQRLLGIKLNWLLEMGGILIIIAGTRLRVRRASPAY